MINPAYISLLVYIYMYVYVYTIGKYVDMPEEMNVSKYMFEVL